MNILVVIVPYGQLRAQFNKNAQNDAKKLKSKRDAVFRAGGGNAKVKQFQDKGFTAGQARRATMNQGNTNLRRIEQSKKRKQRTLTNKTTGHVVHMEVQAPYVTPPTV